ncbi:AAA family ATPase [Scytonema sp. NUACC21]
MTKIVQYHSLEKIATSDKTVIYRATLEPGSNSVILKILKSEYPKLEEITRFKQEYIIRKQLNCQGIVKAYSLEKYQNRWALILEDFGGQSLKQLLERQTLQLKEILHIVISLASSLHNLHFNQIIHQDIKPSNIIINYATGQVKITDFSISTYLERETPESSNPKEIQGTLAYMSPEQTGRMNRLVDYRTDFYSLGVTFYEMLTRRLPFTTTDPMELVHCHIAKKPIPPIEVDPFIPQPISNIIMRLLAKNAEERYQTALGIKADLENCLSQLETKNFIENFLLGSWDKTDRLLIPQKLYGRSTEVNTLMNAFKEVREGKTEMMLIVGYSGVGKTSVVNEVHKPIVEARGYFISGKFDQYKRNIPYSPLIKAFQSLIQQILTENSEKIALWKQKLLNVFGSIGQILIDVIPEVELIVGSQPQVPQLRASESQNRFHRIFQQFIHVFCQKEHPLVLFLDDLQWADSASLKLIELLITDPDSQYLLLIGAYRDNEVSATHPLMLTVDKIQKSSTIVKTIILNTLDSNTVNKLLAETLNLDAEITKNLADILLLKTDGNPFFLTQLIKSLYSEKLLVYDVSNDVWQWNIEQIQSVGITDNVVDLMVGQIQKLAISTQNVLRLAACIGNQFNLYILSIVNEKSLKDTAFELFEALKQGLVLPLNSEYKIPLMFHQEDLEKAVSELRIDYKFLHDRVQQAAYALIPEEQKQALHLQVGQLLLENLDEEPKSEDLFEIVNHLNIGADLITSQAQKHELAALNLTVGQYAKSATAYEAARRYFHVGMGLLAGDSWTQEYNLTLALYVEAVEVEYLNTNFSQAEALGEIVLQKATSLLDQVKVYELKIQMYAAQQQMLKAVETGVQALERMGICLSSTDSDRCEGVALPRLEDLEDISEITDSYKLAAMRLLITLSPPAYQTTPQIFPLIILTQVNLCMEGGYSALSASTYSWYGLLLCGALEDIESGYHSGLVALKLLEKYDAKEFKCLVMNQFNIFIRPWKRHIRESLAPLIEALQSGLETGDIVYASYCAANYCTYLFAVEETLEAVEEKQSPLIDLLAKLKIQVSIYYANIWRQLNFNLRGLVADKYQLIGQSFNETDSLPKLYSSRDSFSLFNFYLAKTILLYLFKNSTEAVVVASLAEEHIQSAVGLVYVAYHKFYDSLALLAEYSNVEFNKQQEYLERVEKNQAKMRLWAFYAPMNFTHKYDLVEAEKARVFGQNWSAMELYDRAITGAREHGYLQEEALAYEKAAEFYLAHGKTEIAVVYITKAHYGYVRWGAKAKVQDLELRYPNLLQQELNRKTTSVDVRTTTSTSEATVGKLDLATVMKASLAVSSEIILEKLLDNLIRIVIENTGAENGLLILQKDSKFVIEAVGNINSNEELLWKKNLLNKKTEISPELVPLSIINYVSITKENVVLNDATSQEKFVTDIYIIKNKPKSILCTPLIYKGTLIGLFYLENNLTYGAFTSDRLEVLKLLSSQVVISLENARLYANLSVTSEKLKKANEQLEEYSRTLEVKVEKRTLELQENNQRLKEKATQLQKALLELKDTQAQLIQTEKMSSLGQLVAGIAHEINNPINFIYGNITHTSEYIENLLYLIDLYHQEYPNPTPKIVATKENIDLDFLVEDLPKILSSIKLGVNRIRQIVLSLRNFSRLDEAIMKPVNIHEGIESTLLILQHRLQETMEEGVIQVIKEYGEIPLVECFAGQINQVFMNILSNAIDALRVGTGNRKGELNNSECQIPTIWICTKMVNSEYVAICIADNGPGMTEVVRRRLFDPFFTTKPVGKGTGLGLFISYSIIVEKHHGSLKCISEPNQGAQLIIEIPIRYRAPHLQS